MKTFVIDNNQKEDCFVVERDELLFFSYTGGGIVTLLRHFEEGMDVDEMDAVFSEIADPGIYFNTEKDLLDYVFKMEL